MVPSLFKLLGSLILSGDTGRLNVFNASGRRGAIYLDGGHLPVVEAGEMTGAAAAKEIAQWVTITTEFDENTPAAAGGKGVAASAYMALLEKADRLIRQVRQVIPDNHALFKLVVEDESFDTLGAGELKVALALNGRRTVGQVVGEAGLSELEALCILRRLHLRGMARKMSAYPPMTSAERGAFLGTVEDELVELVGPAAGVIMSEAFQSLRIEPQLLAQEQIPQLIESISSHLDPDETATFSRRVSRSV